MKLNNKGFTLIELLAALVILALLMAVAAPNVLGIISKNRNATYVEDAQKLVARAEYTLRSDPKITKPAKGQCVVFTLGYLDDSEFNNPPYGGGYYATYSYVVVKREVSGGVSKYNYYVQLIERMPQNTAGNDRGIKLINVDTLSEDNVGDHVQDIESMTTSLKYFTGDHASQGISLSSSDGVECASTTAATNKTMVYNDDSLYSDDESVLSKTGNE